MAIGFNERKHGGFPWRFNEISFLFKSRITGSKQSSILLYTHCGSHFLVRTVFIDFLESEICFPSEEEREEGSSH